MAIFQPDLTRLQKWGGISSFIVVVASIWASYLYLTGNLKDQLGSFSYSLADLLYGPVFAASLVTVVSALKERFGDSAPRRMNLALIATVAAGFGFILVALIRSANRQYHLNHPELLLESSVPILTIWTTLVSGITGAAWHILGWVLLLTGWSGWTSKKLPRLLSVFYVIAGLFSLLVYIFPFMEGNALLVFSILSIWQGVLLLTGKPPHIQDHVVQGE